MCVRKPRILRGLEADVSQSYHNQRLDLTPRAARASEHDLQLHPHLVTCGLSVHNQAPNIHLQLEVVPVDEVPDRESQLAAILGRRRIGRLSRAAPPCDLEHRGPGVWLDRGELDKLIERASRHGDDDDRCLDAGSQRARLWV